MARAKKSAISTQAAAEASPENGPVTMPPAEAASGIAAEEPRQPATETAAKPAYAPDPHEKISISLCGIAGGPAMHLLRSHRFRQLQIRFDREQPAEQYLAMLKRAGWTDRTESEGVWTKQIDPDARWQSVRQMEQEFREVANAIRVGKKLKPVQEGIGRA